MQIQYNQNINPYFKQNYLINNPLQHNVNNINSYPQVNTIYGNYQNQIPLNVITQKDYPNPQISFNNYTNIHNKILNPNNTYINITNKNQTQNINIVPNKNYTNNINYSNEKINNKIIPSNIKKGKNEQNYIKEKGFENMPKSISLEAWKILGEKMEKYICKIKSNNNKFGTGFFCNIQISWNYALKVIITCNHVLNEDDIKLNEIYKIFNK